jgi:thermostable 8-oxoguanine DNA glycosylase
MYLVRISVVRSLHNVVVVDIISCALAFCILTADISASLAKTPVHDAIDIVKP